MTKRDDEFYHILLSELQDRMLFMSASPRMYDDERDGDEEISIKCKMKMMMMVIMKMMKNRLK